MLASTPPGEHGVVFQPNNNNNNFNNQYSVASPSMMNGSSGSFQQQQYYTNSNNNINNNGYPQTMMDTRVDNSINNTTPTVVDNKKDQKSEKKKKKNNKDKKGRSAEPRLPYKVLHQKLVLDVDLYQKALIGYTDIIITPFHNNIDQISLHCLQSNVTGVHVLYMNKHKSQNVQQQTEDQIQQVIHNNIQNQVKHHDLEVSIKEFMLQYDIENEGTLTIKFKTPLLKKTSSSIRIFFDLKNPLSGVYFVDTKKDPMIISDDNLSTSNNSTTSTNNEMIDENIINSTMPHMYTQSQMQGARCWFPCVDLLSSFHSFEFEITSHAEAMIICSGDLIKQVENYSGTLKTSYFKTKSIISPSSVCIAVGPFNISYSSLTLNSYDLILNAFYLPNYSLESIRHTLGFIKRALIFLEDYLEFKYKDLFNLNTLNIVFIENGYTKQSTFSGICLLDSNQMILDPNIIDTVQDNRMSLVRLITEQFFGNFIHSKTWSDYWLIEGIAGYLAYQYYENEFGQNAKRFKIMKTGKELLSIENHTQSLYIENYCHPSELLTEYLIKKSPLVIYMIDRQISTSNMRNLLNKFLKNAHTLDVNSKRYNDRLISSSSFIKTIGKTFATDLKEFSSYWIYGTGIPQFAISFKYDDMRSCVDLKVKQILPFPEIQPFRGKVTVRILESEGAPNDFIANLDKEENQFEFHINSKPVKKHHKKVQGGQGQPTEAVRVIIPLKWIRFDPEQDWIKVQSFSQTQEMWNYQLNDVKDVVAQYESIKALTFFADTEPVITILNKIIRDNSYYYQIRVCAAHALSKIPQPIEKKEALNVLIGFFKTQFYDEQLTYLKPNNFKNFADYFLKKEIPLALTNFKDDKVNNETFPEVVLLLLELIKYNDDSENLFSGNFYIANLIKSISLLNTSNPNFNQKIEKILYKYLVIDSDLIPSYHYIKTVTSLESIANLQASGKSKVNLDVFYRYLDFKKSDHVRFSSWRCVMNILDSVLDLSNMNNNNMNMNNNNDKKNVITSSGEMITECYSHELLTHVKIIFNRFISLLNDENETSHVKYEIAKIITQSIFNCSARMLLEYNNNSKKVNSAFIKKISALGIFLIDIRLSKITNRNIVDLIWNYLHDCKFTQFDFKLRSIIMNLYKSIWSSNIPLCYDSKYVNNNNFDHAILIAPSLFGITDLKIVQPQQLKSHQYLASEQPRVVFDSSQLSNFISSPALAPTSFTTTIKSSSIEKKKRSKSSSAATTSNSSHTNGSSHSSTGSSSGSTTSGGLSVIASSSTPTTITISTLGQSTTVNSSGGSSSSSTPKKESKKKESSSSSKSKSSSKKESSSSDKKDKDSSDSKKKDSEKKKSKKDSSDKKEKDSDKKEKDSEKKRKRDSEKSSPSSSSKKKKEVAEPVTPTTVKIKLNTPTITTPTAAVTSATPEQQPKKKKSSSSSTSKSKSEKLTTPAASEKSSSSASSSSTRTTTNGSNSTNTIKKESIIDDQLVTPSAAAVSSSSVGLAVQSIGKNEKESIEKKTRNREDRKKKFKATRLILITFDTSELKVYVELDDDSPTADVIYRSVPIVSHLVQSGGKGIIYFNPLEIEHVELEETARSEIKPVEIAYWVSGTAFVFGFGKTPYSIGNETRLYQPCNIFGEMLYPVKSLQKTAFQQKVTVSRFPRVYIDLPDIGKRIDIDMYDTFKDITIGHVAPKLPYVHTFMPLFYQILYFNIGHIETKYLETVSPGFYRDYLYPGEIAYWAGGASILLGTGPTDIEKHNSKEVRYNLLENCFIIGKIVSSGYNLLPDLIKDPSTTRLHFNRRELVITIDFEPNQHSGDENSLNRLEVLIGVSGTMSGDIIFDTCFNGYTTFDHEIIQPNNEKCGIIGIKLNSAQDPILETLQHEINIASETAKLQEVVLFWDSHTIGFPFSNEAVSSFILPEMANPIGSFKQILNTEMNYYQFIDFMQERRVEKFTIKKRQFN